MTRRFHATRATPVGASARRQPTGPPRAHDERGATLILALIFIVVVSVMTTALTSWVTGDLNNTAKFTSAQLMDSAANSAAEAALQSVRYSFAASTLNASPPVPCWTAGTTPGQITVDEQFTTKTLSAWCSTFYDPLSTNTRTVTISTCLSSVSAATCASSPILQAVVVFDDYSATDTSECTTSPTDQQTCGTGMSIVSWAFGVVPPTVTSVADPGSCASTKLVTVNGTGFSGATSVNFTPTANSESTITQSPSSVASTTVTACAPSQLTTGTTYQVTVTTPGGTSATSSASILTY